MTQAGRLRVPWELVYLSYDLIQTFDQHIDVFLLCAKIRDAGPQCGYLVLQVGSGNPGDLILGQSTDNLVCGNCSRRNPCVAEADDR